MYLEKYIYTHTYTHTLWHQLCAIQIWRYDYSLYIYRSIILAHMIKYYTYIYKIDILFPINAFINLTLKETHFHRSQILKMENFVNQNSQRC